MLRSDEEVRGDEVTPARRRMLDAAIEAFAEHGYGGTGTRDIARRAGRSPASVYVHYPSKEHLLFGASILGHQEALEVVLDAVSGAGNRRSLSRRCTIDDQFANSPKSASKAFEKSATRPASRVSTMFSRLLVKALRVQL